MLELIDLATTTSNASSVAQQRSSGVAGKKEFAEIATKLGNTSLTCELPDATRNLKQN
jgi:hypothetical protein